MVTRKAAPTLAAGCTTVVKPLEETPFSTLHWLRQPSLPSSHGHMQQTGYTQSLCKSQLVCKVSFTVVVCWQGRDGEGWGGEEGRWLGTRQHSGHVGYFVFVSLPLSSPILPSPTLLTWSQCSRYPKWGSLLPPHASLLPLLPTPSAPNVPKLRRLSLEQNPAPFHCFQLSRHSPGSQTCTVHQVQECKTGRWAWH